ncbi:MAG TPA: hypothetical protein VGK67_24185 [Myxococcales bacterium]|jgi:hypothetical protein
MSLLPEDAGYLEHVQAYFLAFRGDGVSLSPLDAELLADWMARGVPYPVVCRGIRRAAESLLYNNGASARLRTLRSCRSAVEREFRHWEGAPATPIGKEAPSPETAAPASAESFAVKRLKKARASLRKALAEATPEAAKAAIESAQAIVAMELDDPRQVSVLVARADDALCLVYLRRLHAATRRALMREARCAAGPRPEGASRRARKDALRAHRVALARSHGQLPTLT